MKTTPYKTVGQLEDKYFGKIGTSTRNQYEYELEMEILSEKLRQLRKERNLTQEELGKLVGVQKAQISKLERSVNNTTIATILKVFQALDAKVLIRIDAA
ncbi:MAG: helix-turn-helix transcriptional regulator [Bacteroidales bacterium]